MKITVRVKPNARRDSVVLESDGTYTVSVTAPPVDGKANEKLIEVLSGHFGKPRRLIRILRGTSGRHKIVSVD